MRVSSFMKPADKVISVAPSDTLRKATDCMLNHKVGCVVVVPTENGNIPIGILTKTDLVKAFHDGISIDQECKDTMGGGDKLITVPPHMNRDEAAKILERTERHHAIVADPDTNKFLGLISSWDITAECAKDDRAWPWNRSEDGKFHHPASPTTTLVHPTSQGQPHLGDSFRDYIDRLDITPDM